ncbi:SRSF protein kinase 3-like isoform X2 [Drosophila ficusphila]|uniref:SRSF protein kinase 3-like isoform X2 n=1 Tax=Drosophila ficusphila TaxID=30025 RepID=UPI0007E71975|nr:SRSF protein kinase 3-like isoform X2 [Drosophila ficusphila]
MSDDFELDLGTSDLDEHERANRTPVPMEPNDRYSLVTNYLGQLQPNWQTADHEENRYGSSEDGDATPRVHTSPTVILRRAPFPVSEGSEMTSQAYSSPIEDGGSEGEGRDQDSSQINGTEESSADYRIGGYHPVAVGDIFKDRYHAIYKLGWGHFSIVWLCYDARMERYCAIKVVKSGQHYMETARDEVRLLQAIAESAWHPLRHRIVEFLDHFYISKQNGTHHCLVFEVLGDNLLTLIQMSNYQGLPIGNVKQIALQVLEGLNFLHSQCRIIHTDLKPENVLLVADDSTVRCQVNQAVTNFLKGHGQLHKQGHGDGTAKLTKTAKRRRRAQAKRSVAFFQEHRRWLRQRAIEDLLSLAERGQLSPVAAALGVTGKLRFMPFLFDDLVILTDNDMAELQRYFMTERVGDMPTALLNNRPPPQTGANQTGSVNASNANPGQKSDGSFSALRLLLKSPEQFMRYVQQKVTEADQKEMARNQYGKKQRAPKKHRKNEKKKKESRRKSSSVWIITEHTFGHRYWNFQGSRRYTSN